jgi:RNA polymerase sigma-70 factor (ECF subfamily)
MGGDSARRPDRVGRGSTRDRYPGTVLNEAELRAHWWAAVASVTRMTRDLATAEDAVQDACVSAMIQWPVEGQPDNPRGWLIAVARRKAIDRIRREAQPQDKKAAAVREREQQGPDDELSLIFLCCHPALDPAARIALTLRSVCGLSTAEV